MTRKLALAISLTVFLLFISPQGKLKEIKANYTGYSLNLADGKDSSELPDFWPDRDTITDTSTLNLEWFPEEDVNGAIPLKQRHLYYESQLNVRIHGLYVRPAFLLSSPIPGMVLLHGGSSNYRALIPIAHFLVEALGYGILCLDSPGTNYTSSDGWGSTGPMYTPAFRGNVTGPDGPRGSYTYYNVIAALRGITVLQSIPEINSSLVGLGGFSEGGIATLIANGVESKYQRLKFTVDLSAPGNWNQDFFETSVWSYWYDVEWGTEKCQILLDAFDPINYAPLAYAPTLMICGTNDQVFPLMLFKQTFEELSEPKALSVLPGQDHYVYRSFQNLESMLIWCQLIIEEEAPYAIPSIDRLERHSNGSMTVKLKLAKESRIDEIGLVHNFENLDFPLSWITENQAFHAEKTLYSWTIDTLGAEEYAFYPLVFREGLPVFSGVPVFHSDMHKYTESKSSELTTLEVLIALTLISYATMKKRKMQPV
ncbi:MAG: alpha/beta hydrolase family protein [Candidatus Hodarchaeota archaeon]